MSKELQDKNKVDEILELRKRLFEANKNREFDESRKIAEEIRNLTQVDIEVALQPTLRDLDEEMNTMFDTLKVTLEQLRAEYDDRIYCLRLDTDKSFNEIKERQLQEYVELETERQSEILRAQTRLSSKVQTLYKMSTNLANRGEFDKAESISREADDLHQIEFEESVRRLGIRFHIREEKMLQQFTVELNVLKNRLDKSLLQLQMQYEHDERTSKQTAEVTIRRLLLKHINKANEMVGRKDKQTEVNTRLTRFVRKKANENGMNRKLLFDD